jgi:hypothetical protein
LVLEILVMRLDAGRGPHSTARARVQALRQRSFLQKKNQPGGAGFENLLELQLEGELQAKFDLTRRTQRVDAGTGAHAVGEVARVCRAIDAAGLTVEQA